MRYSKRKLVFAVMDLLIINLGFLLALILRFNVSLTQPSFFLRKYLFLFLYSFLWIPVFQSHSLYKQQIFLNKSAQAYKLLKSVTLNVVILIILSFLAKSTFVIQSRLTVGLIWIFIICLMIVLRCFWYPRLFRWMEKRNIIPERTLIIGCGNNAKRVAESISKGNSIIR